MVATFVLFDCHEKMTPDISCPPESKAFAVNCFFAPASIVAVAGEISIRAIAGQTAKAAPFTRVPGLNNRPLLPVAVECSVKLPVTSRERVSYWPALPFNPVEPP